ncbi:DUF937 domain-containing protein [Shivajiella indica]|uniref:DUF937 domain-containing protein n=1 Tax=Shivajiella indica TaxID=872115 RepID=A0ABW5B5G5_9BACT
MIQDILKNLSPELISGLTNQVGLNFNQANEALNTTKESLVNSLSKEVTSGNFDGILNMLNAGANASKSPLFDSIAGNLTKNYISKIGLSPQIAGMVTSFVLPKIISTLTNSKSGSFGQADLIKMIGQEAGGSLGDKASSLLKGGLGNLFK